MSLWRRWAVAGIAIALGLVAAIRLSPKVSDRYKPLLSSAFLSSREQRLIHFFGECEPAGYGYLKRVLTAYSRIEPNPLKRPVIRYRDYNRRSEYLFEPTRFEADPSVLVGVWLAESDLREQEIGSATRGADGLWRIAVDRNFDLLTRVEVEAETGRAQHLRLQLYRSERDSTPVWTSTVDAATAERVGRQTLQFVATPPLREFRYGLVEPFVFRVDGGFSVDRVTAYGVVVDMQGYRVVHREGDCFTAVEDDHSDRWTQLSHELEGSND
jgi:hypothetical protein